MTRELSELDTKAVKEASYDGETEVDVVLGKVIQRSKYYNIACQIGVIISQKEIN